MICCFGFDVLHGSAHWVSPVPACGQLRRSACRTCQLPDTPPCPHRITPLAALSNLWYAGSYPASRATASGPPTSPLTCTKRRTRSSPRTKCAAGSVAIGRGRGHSALPHRQLRPRRAERSSSPCGWDREMPVVTNEEVKYGMVQPDHACAWSASWSCRRLHVASRMFKS